MCTSEGKLGLTRNDNSYLNLSCFPLNNTLDFLAVIAVQRPSHSQHQNALSRLLIGTP